MPRLYRHSLVYSTNTHFLKKFGLLVHPLSVTEYDDIYS